MADDDIARVRANVTATLDHCAKAQSGWRPTPVPDAGALLLRARVLAAHHQLDQKTGLIIAWNDIRDQLAMQLQALDRSGKLALEELQAWDAHGREMAEARRAG